MNCPFCGNEMTKGWVQSTSRVLFTSRKRESGFVFKAKSDIILAGMIDPSCVAYHCDACRKVVIDYAEQAE